jgi:hypothetical protein
MQDRFAFTAKYRGQAAMVCRALENRPGPIVDQEFGLFETWTQANTFATRLNQGVEIHPTEAERIVTGSILRSGDVVRAVDYDPGDPLCGARAGRSIRVEFLLAELALAATSCGLVPCKPTKYTERLLRNARNAHFNAMHYMIHSKLSSRDVQAITARLQRLQAAFRKTCSRRRDSIPASSEGWADCR